MPRAATLAAALVLIGAAGVAAFWWLSAPKLLPPETIAGLKPGDPVHGEQVFWAGGCVSCHGHPKAEGAAQLELGGGVELKTPFGTFVAPNISPDAKDGIGAWSLADFENAVLRGVSPSGAHLYPAFPYTSYARMTPADVADLFAYLKTLPPVAGRAAGHKLSFPFTIRRGIGLWKLLYLHSDPVVTLPADAGDSVRRGQYLVEGAGHCGECHTPRNLAGGPKAGQWLAGAPDPEGGEGIVPNITSGPGGIGGWSQSDIASFLETGLTPDFDTVGGSMVEVQRNMAKLPASDREAIAAYLKAVPPLPNGYPPRKATTAK